MVYVPGVLAEKLISTVSAGKHAAGGAGTLIQGSTLAPAMAAPLESTTTPAIVP